MEPKDQIDRDIKKGLEEGRKLAGPPKKRIVVQIRGNWNDNADLLSADPEDAQDVEQLIADVTSKITQAANAAVRE